MPGETESSHSAATDPSASLVLNENSSGADVALPARSLADTSTTCTEPASNAPSGTNEAVSDASS